MAIGGNVSIRLGNWLCILLLLSQSSCALIPQRLTADSIEGWVVDADTKKPLQGVNVVADWILFGGLEGGNVDGHIHVSETVSNVDGHFFLPSWEPLWTGIGFGHRNPRIILFKSGYRYREVSNTGVFGGIDPSEQSGPLWVSRWNGQTIELKPFEGSLQEYADHLSSLDGSIGFIAMLGCWWKEIPHLLHSLTEQNQIFRSAGVRSLLSHTLDKDGYFFANEESITRECNFSPRELL